jgi:hypothetical protein
MPQKGLERDDGVRGRREKLSSKGFPCFHDLKSTFPGTLQKNHFFSNVLLKTPLYKGILYQKKDMR